MTALHSSSVSGRTGTFPESVRPEEFRSVKVHRKNVEKSCNQKEEAGNQREGIHEMAHHLGGEQDLENAQTNQTMLIVEARNPVFEERGREAGLSEEQNYDLDDVKSDDEKCSKCPSRLIGNTRIIVIIAVLVILIEAMVDSLNILSHDDNIGDKDEKERNHGKTTQGIEEEKLGLGGERKHDGQQMSELCLDGFQQKGKV